MKKFLKDVMLAFAILGMICAAFYKLGWFTNSREAVTLFAIAVIVIVVNKIEDKFTVGLYKAVYWKRQQAPISKQEPAPNTEQVPASIFAQEKRKN